eukprot:gene17794-15274_t
MYYKLQTSRALLGSELFGCCPNLQLCLSTAESLIIVDDFSLTKAPENLKNKFNVTAGPSSSSGSGSSGKGKSSSSKMILKEKTLR